MLGNETETKFKVERSKTAHETAVPIWEEHRIHEGANLPAN